MKKQLLQLTTFLTLLFFSNLINAQAPTLGTASNFVLFTTVGAVGNTGISQVTGHVGTNSGSSTGFGNVNGVMHDNDGASGQAAADLLLAYNQLNTATPTFFPTSSLLGNGAILTPGVYYLPAVTTLSGELILDAQGNANAVFIFQIQAAFSTNAASKITLINGALACNVFWKIEGLVSIAPKTFMKGTIVAHNAAINMNTNDTLEGRALSIAGAISVDGVLAYIPTGCGSPVLTGPAAPPLGAASCYAIFSANGSVSNSGTTTVTGDIGTNVGLSTGFNPLLVNGTIHPIADGSTAQTAADLLVTYDNLNTIPHDIELLYPAQFGRNLVLTPHTYLMNGAATFTDSLYLNAEGNANAIFVIKIKGALSTSSYSKVLLRNGTQAKNVYWVVDGAVGINDYSVFNGTIVCNNGAINLAIGVELNGRALTTGGALSTVSITASSPSGNCITLPVNWLYFKGKAIQNTVLLEWSTTNELNNGFFTIEKSKDGISFEKLATINAAGGTDKAENNYSFTDIQPSTLGYYRISQTDKDGRKNIYRTISVQLNANDNFRATNYLLNNQIYVQTSGATPGEGFIRLMSVSGKRLYSKKIVLTKELSTFKIDRSLQKGIYILIIGSRNEQLYSGKVMVF